MVPAPPPRYETRFNPDKSNVLKLIILFCRTPTTLKDVPKATAQRSHCRKSLTFLKQEIRNQIKQRLLEILEVSRRLIDLSGAGLPPLGAVWQLLSRSMLSDNEPWCGTNDGHGSKHSEEDLIRLQRILYGGRTDSVGNASGNSLSCINISVKLDVRVRLDS